MEWNCIVLFNSDEFLLPFMCVCVCVCICVCVLLLYVLCGFCTCFHFECVVCTSSDMLPSFVSFL